MPLLSTERDQSDLRKNRNYYDLQRTIIFL